MKEYEFTLKVTGYLHGTVKAESPEEAKRYAAYSPWASGHDFGDLEDVDWDDDKDVEIGRSYALDEKGQMCITNQTVSVKEPDSEEEPDR